MPSGVYIRTEYHNRLNSEAHEGLEHSKETIKKMSEIKKGNKHPMYGRHHSEETKKEISRHNVGMIGQKHTDETKKKMSLAHKGKKLSEEHKKNLSRVRKGMKFSKERNQKLSKSLRGVGNPFFGKKHSEESKRKIGIKSKQKWIAMSEEAKLKLLKPFWTKGIKAAQKANPSSIEKMIWKVLDELNIEYRTQYKIGGWFADIYIPDKNLIIECNGTYWHNYKIFPKRKIRDDALEEYAKDNGYKLIWLWEDEIKEDPKSVLEREMKIKNEILEKEVINNGR